MQETPAEFDLLSMTKRLLSIVLLLFIAACTSAPQPRRVDAIVIKENDQHFQLTVPISKLDLLVPKQTFARDNIFGNTGPHPRYFIFNDRSRSLTLSGWFEPAERYPGIQKLWESYAGTRVGEPLAPTDVRFTKVGAWDTVAYNLPLSATPNTHVKAELVQAGTWIELHLSTGSGKTTGEQFEQLADVLRSLQVREKP